MWIRTVWQTPCWQLGRERYGACLLLIAPMLNFLSGINIDLYAPSLPQIASVFGVSMVLVKSTIAVTMLGFSVGCLIVGTLIDTVGRRRTILSGLLLYTLFSALAGCCRDIHTLMLLRFMQGMTVASASIGARTLVVDFFTGQRLAVAMAYTSVSYAVGPMVAPYIGSWVQFYFGWQANFVVYALFGAALVVLFALLVQESAPIRLSFCFKSTWKQYAGVVCHGDFMIGVLILALIVISQMVYPTLGPFVVERVLHQPVIVYGHSALVVGASYLVGTLVNRLMVRFWTTLTLVTVGFSAVLIGVLMQCLFALLLPISVFSITLPLAVILFGLGWVFPNVLMTCLSLFSQRVGVASAVQAFLLTSLAALGLSLLSGVHITSLWSLCWLYGSLVLLQCLLFFVGFRRVMLVDR